MSGFAAYSAGASRRIAREATSIHGEAVAENRRWASAP